MAFLEFNVDRAATCKPKSVGIGGGLHGNKGKVMFMFPNNVRVEDPNEAVLVSLEALRI